MKSSWKHWSIAGLISISAAGCGTYAPTMVQPGQTAEDVTRAMGEPTGRYALKGGLTRLEYARGPYGKHTWMIELGADGRVTRVLQVLTEEQFSVITPGTSRQDLLATLGRPSDDRGAPGGGRWWAYRYDSWACQLFVVTLGTDDQVQNTGYAIDPRCEAGDRRDRS
jgi:outer membrane protein assembly factor BamE (lipoprotein component of BamABCDE complex)